MGRNSLLLYSGFAAFSIYIGIVVLIAMKMIESEKTPETFSYKKETTFDISLESIKVDEKPKKTQKKNAPKPAPITAKETVKSEKEDPKEASETVESGQGIERLFEEIEAKAPVKKKEFKLTSRDDAAASRLKGDLQKKSKEQQKRIESALSGIDLKDTMTFTTTTGISDEYYSKIHEILSKNWGTSGITKESSAGVKIFIDRSGNFDYKITNRSSNESFNNLLLQFLEKMKDTQFPPYTRGEQTEIEVKFKTEGFN